jgi:hypothetical protein
MDALDTWNPAEENQICSKRKEPPAPKRRKRDTCEHDFTANSEDDGSNAASDVDFVAGKGKAGKRGAGGASDEDPSFEVIGDESARKARIVPAPTGKAGLTAQGRDGKFMASRMKRRLDNSSPLPVKEDKHAVGRKLKRKAKSKHADEDRRRADCSVRQKIDVLDFDDLGLDISAIQSGKRRRFAKFFDASFDAGDVFDSEEEMASVDRDVAVRGTGVVAGTRPAAAAAAPVTGRAGHKVHIDVLPDPVRLEGVEPHTRSAPSDIGAALTRPCEGAPHPAPEQRSAVVVHQHQGDDTSEDDFDPDCVDDAAAADAWRQQRGVPTLGTSLRREVDLIDEMDLDDLGSDAEDLDDWGSDDSAGGQGALAVSPQRRSCRVVAGSRMQAVLKAEHDEWDYDDEVEMEGGAAHLHDSVATSHPRRKLVIKRVRVTSGGKDSSATAPNGRGQEAGLPVIGGDAGGEQPKKRIKLKVRRTGQAGGDAVAASAPAFAPAASRANDAEHVWTHGHVDTAPAAEQSGAEPAVPTDTEHEGDAAADDTPTRLRGSGVVDNATSPAPAGSPAAAPASADMVAASACEVPVELRPEERAALPLVLAALRALPRSSLRYTLQDSPADVHDPEGLLDALEVCSAAAHLRSAGDWPTLVGCCCNVHAQVGPYERQPSVWLTVLSVLRFYFHRPCGECRKPCARVAWLTTSPCTACLPASIQ